VLPRSPGLDAPSCILNPGFSAHCSLFCCSVYRKVCARGSSESPNLPTEPAKLTAPVRWFRPTPGPSGLLQFSTSGHTLPHANTNVLSKMATGWPGQAIPISIPKLPLPLLPSSRHGSAVNSSAHWLFIHFKCSDIADLWLFYLGKKAMVDQATDRPTCQKTGSFCPSPPAALSRLFGETMQCRASINKLA